MTPPIRALLEFQCQRARAYFARAPPRSCRASDARSLVAAEIMGGIYFGILRRIERAGYDVFTPAHPGAAPGARGHRAAIWLRTLARARAHAGRRRVWMP